MKNKKSNDLKKRVNLINSSKADLFLSIHLNSYSSTNISGPQVFFQNNAKSIMLANNIQKSLEFLKTGKKRMSKHGDYYILNKTSRIGVIVECGFLSNDSERSLLVQESYQRKIAQLITRGIVNYFIE